MPATAGCRVRLALATSSWRKRAWVMMEARSSTLGTVIRVGSSRGSGRSPTSTATTGRGASCAAASTGTSATTPPSKRYPCSQGYGGTTPGTAEEAATAFLRLPWRSATAFPVAKSVATAANGLGSSSTATSGTRNATARSRSASSTRARRCRESATCAPCCKVLAKESSTLSLLETSSVRRTSGR